MIAVVVTFLMSLVLCGFYVKLAHHKQILAHPNVRSSHQIPTPHGGGVALFIAFFGGLFLASTYTGVSWHTHYLWLSLLTLILLGLGILDDLLDLPVRVRFSCYALCCVGSSYLLIGTGELIGYLFLPVAAFALLWGMNLFNFMDGIDGIAAIQCILACVSAALLSWFAAGDEQYALFCLLLATAQMGFLVWNWPPARLFMGDAGSIPSGFLLGSLALLATVENILPWSVWLILMAGFVVDASFTLLWRLFSGQAITQPHRLHAYQRLSDRWGGPLAVDVALLALNGLWLFPLALTSTIWPKFSFLLVILAYLPLLLGMAKIRNIR